MYCRDHIGGLPNRRPAHIRTRPRYRQHQLNLGTDGAYRREERGVVRLCIESFCRVERPQDQVLYILRPQPYIGEGDSKYQLSCGIRGDAGYYPAPLEQLRRTSDHQNSRPRRVQRSAPDNRDLVYPSNVFAGRNKRVDPQKPTPPVLGALLQPLCRSTLCHIVLGDQSVTGPISKLSTCF